jgi:TolB-like protein
LRHAGWKRHRSLPPPLRRRGGGIVGTAAAIFLLIGGCAPAPRGYRSPDLVLHGDSRLAILPFDNLTGMEGASRQVYDVFLVEFLRAEAFSVIDPGEVERTLARERIRFTSELSREQVRKIGGELGASLLVQGAILEYGTRQVQGYAVVEVPYATIMIKIIDAGSGEILWASTHSRNGNDTEMLFGFGRISSLNRLTAEMAREMVDSLKTAAARGLRI